MGEAPHRWRQLRESLVQETVDFRDAVNNVVWRKTVVGVWPLVLWIVSVHHILEAGRKELRRIVGSAADDVHPITVAALQAKVGSWLPADDAMMPQTAVMADRTF